MSFLPFDLFIILNEFFYKKTNLAFNRLLNTIITFKVIKFIKNKEQTQI